MIVIISGPGGVGKGTLVAALLRRVPGLKVSRSWTTRARRLGEPGDAYVFVDRPTFEARVAEDGFLEWTEFDGTGHLYGTPTLDVVDDETVILEIELDGAQQVKTRYPAARLILVVPPSPQVQGARLRRRGDDETSIRRRLEVGAQEVELGRRIADFVVVNDDLDRATDEVAGIVTGHISGT